MKQTEIIHNDKKFKLCADCDTNSVKYGTCLNCGTDIQDGLKRFDELEHELYRTKRNLIIKK